MSKFILFSRFNQHNFTDKSRRKNWRFSFNPKFFRLFVFSMIIGFGIFYLIQINQVSTFGFKLKTLQDQVDRLKTNNEKLEVQAAQMKSMQRIEELSKELNLVSAGSVKYLSSASSAVAAK